MTHAEMPDLIGSGPGVKVCPLTTGVASGMFGAKQLGDLGIFGPPTRTLGIHMRISQKNSGIYFGKSLFKNHS